MAQAQVNDQLKDLDGSPSNNNFKFPNNWKFPTNSFANFNNQPTPIYPVFGSQGQQQQPHHDNRRQKKPPKNNVVSDHDFPLLSQLSNYNNGKKPKRNPGLVDYSSWNTNSNKKHRVESQQFSASNQNKIFIRPVMKNKHSRDEQMMTKQRLPRLRHATPSTEMRPPPPAMVNTPNHIVLKKVV